MSACLPLVTGPDFDPSRIRLLSRGSMVLVMDRVSGRWVFLPEEQRGLLQLLGAASPEQLPPLLRSILAGWCAMRVVSCRNDAPASACRPFSADRDGLVLAEGAAMLILEEISAARARGARIYAEIAGYGETSDARHLTTPSLAGEVRAIRKAIFSANIDVFDIDYINAHGTATLHNDRIETQAFLEALGTRARAIPVSATKSMTGHAMGASGAIEVAATALSVHHRIVHPTINLTVRDPECDLDHVADESRHLEIDYALKTSFAFGGANAAIILSGSTP